MSQIDFTVAQRKKEEEGSLDLPNRGIIKYPISEIDSVNASIARKSGTNVYQIRHPYFGVNSWIRTMPDPGTEILVQPRGDSYISTITGYSPTTIGRLHEEAKIGNAIFRRLLPGEIEVMSSGRAYIFCGDSGDIEMRGGTIRHELLQTEMEVRSISPTYRRRLAHHTSDELKHEERFGIVKRPDTDNPYNFNKFYRDASSKEFGIEYSRWMNRKDGELVASLQEGDVIDSTGEQKKQDSTNKVLRYEKILVHKDFEGTGTLTTQVDNELNILIENSSQAPETKLTLGDRNELIVSCQSLKWSSSQTGQMDFTTSFTLKTNKARINSTDVGFGPSPAIPAVLGTNLVNSILTPMIGALQTFLQLYGADPVIASISPQTVASAASAAAIMASASSSTSNVLSTQVKLTA